MVNLLNEYFIIFVPLTKVGKIEIYMIRMKKNIILASLILIVSAWLFRYKWPASVRHIIGLYTLSEAMDLESYGLICDVLDDSLDSKYIMRQYCKPDLEHLEIALQKEWRDVMNLFLTYGFDPNEINDEGYTLLDRAICYNSLDMCELLLDGPSEESSVYDIDWSEQISVKVDMKNRYGNTALDELCGMSDEEMLNGEWKKRVQFLLDHGAEITERTISIVEKNACEEKADWIHSLLKQKRKRKHEFAEDDIKQIKRMQRQNTYDEKKWYDLLQRIQGYGSTETIKLLLEDFKIQNYLNEEQKEALMIKAVSENTEIMNLYLNKNFPVTPFVLAASIQNKNFDSGRIAKLIHKENQDIIVKNWKNNQDYSLFMVAVEEGRTETISEFYYNCFNIDYKNSSGLTAKKIAQKYNFEDIVDLLESGMNGID